MTQPRTTDEEGRYATQGQNGGVVEGIVFEDLISDEWLSANLHKMDRRDMIYTILALRTHAVRMLRGLEKSLGTEMLDSNLTYGESKEEE